MGNKQQQIASELNPPGNTPQTECILEKEELDKINEEKLLEYNIDHLENLRKDIFESIKQCQSDYNLYLIQVFASLGGIITLLSLNFNDNVIKSFVLLALPFPIIVFTYQNLLLINRWQSRIDYLVEVIYPNYKLLTKFPNRLEWDNWSENITISGYDYWLVTSFIFAVILSIVVPFYVEYQLLISNPSVLNLIILSSIIAFVGLFYMCSIFYMYILNKYRCVAVFMSNLNNFKKKFINEKLKISL